MKIQDKELLLKDLCARLPYGVKGKCEIDASYDTSFDTILQFHKFDAILEGVKEGGSLLFVTPLIENQDEQEFANEEVADGIDIFDFKPYLRSMSSMTEEEKEEYNQLCYNCQEQDSVDYNITKLDRTQLIYVIDWLNAHHFDYRGLIPMGLALPAPDGMYNFK